MSQAGHDSARQNCLVYRLHKHHTDSSELLSESMCQSAQLVELERSAHYSVFRNVRWEVVDPVLDHLSVQYPAAPLYLHFQAVPT